MITLDENNDGREVEIPEGQEFEVVLPENRTTGFRWRLESGGEPACTPSGDSYESPDPAVPGRGGVHRWRFRAQKAGRGTILLVLGRPWEDKGPGARSFRVEARVLPG